MKFTPRYSGGKSSTLSDEELRALRQISQNEVVRSNLLTRLKAVGLIEKLGNGWAVTQQGKVRLLFGAAR